jgi:hypothetical protein
MTKYGRRAVNAQQQQQQQQQRENEREKEREEGSDQEKLAGSRDVLSVMSLGAAKHDTTNATNLESGRGKGRGERGASETISDEADSLEISLKETLLTKCEHEVDSSPHYGAAYPYSYSYSCLCPYS